MVVWKFQGLYRGDAEKCFSEIQSIGESATPRQILDKARDSTTELHKCFEWDDSVAAEKYRLQQARQIVGSLVYQKAETEQPEAPKIRVMQSIVTEDTMVYKPIKIIVQNQNEYSQLLIRAKKELTAFKSRYERLGELEEVFRAIDNL